MTLEAKATPKTKADVRRVLVVDDQPDVREALRLLLKGGGYATETAESPHEALAMAAYGDYDMILIDMNFTWDTTSGEEGLRLLDRLRSQHHGIPVIAMTGWSTIELAVEAMHHGACDFIPKPWDNRHLLQMIQKHLTSERPGQNGMDAELAIARKVQRKLLPQPHFAAYGIECECASLPAGEISGDLYDFFGINDNSMAFLLGDVCGKGIGAALLVANLQATIRSQEDLNASPSKLMDRVNRLFFQSTRPEHYATLFYGVYDSSSGEIRYTNSGHPSPVLLRAGGECELLESTGTVLGAFKDRPFEERSAYLAPGDRVVLYSDGFSESNMESEVDNWAVESVCSLARRYGQGLAGALAAAASSNGKQADDITVMDLRVLVHRSDELIRTSAA
jgi:sigma-B regulation protein RsbU (phosphoserine phosphatase)